MMATRLLIAYVPYILRNEKPSEIVLAGMETLAVGEALEVCSEVVSYILSYERCRPTTNGTIGMV